MLFLVGSGVGSGVGLGDGPGDGFGESSQKHLLSQAALPSRVISASARAS